MRLVYVNGEPTVSMPLAELTAALEAAKVSATPLSLNGAKTTPVKVSRLARKGGKRVGRGATKRMVSRAALKRKPVKRTRAKRDEKAITAKRMATMARKAQERKDAQAATQEQPAAEAV